MPGEVVPPRIAKFADFEVDLSRGSIRKAGREIPIQAKPLQVLRLLLTAHRQTVTREQLRVALWSEDTFVDFEHGLNTAVKKLRKALDVDREARRHRSQSEATEISDELKGVCQGSSPIAANFL